MSDEIKRLKSVLVKEDDKFFYLHGEEVGLYKIPKDGLNYNDKSEQDSHADLNNGDAGFPLSGSFSRSYDSVTGAKYKRRQRKPKSETAEKYTEPLKHADNTTNQISDEEHNKRVGTFKLIRNVLLLGGLAVGAYYAEGPVNNLVDKLVHKGPASARTSKQAANRDYTQIARKLSQNNARISQEYKKFQESQPLDNIKEYVPNAHSGRLGNESTNGYADLYAVFQSLPYGSISNVDAVETVTKHVWNGSTYVETERFTNPADIEKITVSIMKAARTSRKYMQQNMTSMEKTYGSNIMLNGIVAATVGGEEQDMYSLSLLSEDKYKKYLQVLDKETGRDFTSSYKDQDPEMLASALYSDSIRHGFEAMDPKLTAVILLAKGIDNANGGNWKRHLDRMEKAGIGGVAQYRIYNNGRDPSPRELKNMLQMRVMTDNPYDRKQPGSDTTTRSTNEVTGQRYETNQYGQSRERAMQSSVTERRSQIDTQRQNNEAKARQDVQGAVRSLQNILQPKEKK